MVKNKDRATTLSPFLFFFKKNNYIYVYIYIFILLFYFIIIIIIKEKNPSKREKNNHFWDRQAGWLAGKDLMKGSWPPRLASGRHLMQICKVLGNAISPDLGK